MSITPGLLILHGNQLEQLRAAVFGWLQSHPLGPLETDTFLVQSNGVAEWLKIALAEETGICAATQLRLPARQLWEAYRAMLGRDSVPPVSAFDKGPLTWRLMRLLPALLDDDVFGPLRHFLGDGCPERRLQLASRLADLYDQYQVYRADWLDDWACGRDVLRGARGDTVPLAPDQRWQGALWRAVVASVPEPERLLGRASVHTRFVQACERGDPPRAPLPRRLVVFGISSLPYQVLQALAALARHTQVLLAVPNPCRYHWGDIIDGRDLLRAARRRQQLKNNLDLAQVPLEDLHAHSHPLLASWGRQGRDFIRMLDEFDEAGQAAGDDGNAPMRVDLFSEDEGGTLLEQVQAAIRDLLPPADHPQCPPPPHDRSIEFHVAHSVQREVEVLHDRLLAMFAEPRERPLRPRDVVVMVPDIDVFTAAIHAVFGQHRKSDARHIPFAIGDVNDRSVNPLLVALEWLLRLPQQRCRQSEVRDLLDVPALAQRFGLREDDLPVLGAWIEGAGVRWGLDLPHRAGLGLAPAGEQNAWIFGLRRMLLGYASGDGHAYNGIEAYGEVGGLDAALAGSLAQLVEALLAWREILAAPRTPAAWGEQARALLDAFFVAGAEDDRLTLAQLHESLNRLLETCDGAGFDEPVPLAVLRESWLGALDEPTLDHQFVSGGVTFCTLMPMRAVPFRVVCLLGMNDGDFPRRAHKADFDLLALPGMARPGDRSRRDDDRYLMLEALLAARDKLYVSWVGRNVRDNSEQPPSVLVSQLRDYLHAGWRLDLARHTTEHALQPFSRRYFEQDGLPTYAAEWREAHGDGGAWNAQPQAGAEDAGLPPYEPEEGFRLRFTLLASFIRQPVKFFFRHRLGVVFSDAVLVGEDEEPFGLDALQRYNLEGKMLDDSGEPEPVAQVRERLEARAARLAREGFLPIGLPGRQLQRALVDELVPVRTEWLRQRARYPLAAPKLAVSLPFAEAPVEDWVDQLRSDGVHTVWLAQLASRVADRAGAPRGDKLIGVWLRQMAAAAQGFPVAGILVARDVVAHCAPLDPATARGQLAELVRLWRAGMDRPLPVACRTALAQLAEGDARAVYDGDYQRDGEVSDLCLARLWPDFAALSQEPGWLACAERLYGPLADWLAGSVTLAPFGGEAP